MEPNIHELSEQFVILAANKPKIEKFKDGIVICGEFGSKEVDKILKKYVGKLNLIIADPPYGVLTDKKYNADWDIGIKSANYIQWTKDCLKYLSKGASLYMWGGIGKPHNRIFFDYLSRVEDETDMTMQTLITWKKRRGFGTHLNYLFCREEVAWLINGTRPKIFNIPLLDEERGYAGFNKDYPAKSKYFRRSNVWADINELFVNKIHIAEKPPKLAEIMIATHTKKNDIVMDPFAGSGSTGIAAINLGRKFILIERDPKNFKLIVNRLKNYKPGIKEKKASINDVEIWAVDYIYDF